MIDRESFLRERQSGIGGSDAPNLIGVGFRSASEVYRDKTEPVVARPATGWLRRGLELEPIVASMYSEIMGVELVERPLMDRHPERPWQLCHVDRMRPDDHPVQLKTTAGFGDDWGPNGTDQVPEAYRIQCLHEMGVVGAPASDLIALDVVTWQPRVYRILFDRDAWDWLTHIEAEFWDHVQRRQPIDATWEERIAPVAEQVILPSKRVELGADVEALITQRNELGAIRDEADERYKRLGQEIQSRMGDAEIATCGAWKLKRIKIAAGVVPAYERRAYVRLDVRTLKGKQ